MHTHYYRALDQVLHERFGLQAEHLRPGQRFVHRPGITISQQENVDEALDSINAAMVHYDEAYAAHTSWQRPLVVSTITVQRLIGMTAKTLGRRRRIRRFDSIAMTAPVFGGDTIYAETEVLECLPAQDAVLPVRLRTRGINGAGAQVAELIYVAEIWFQASDPMPPPTGCTPALDDRFASHRQRTDGAWIEQTGLFFEELAEGDVIVHWPRRSVFAEEAVRHAWRAFEIQPEMHDLQAALQGGAAHPQVPQTWGLCLVAAATTRTFGRVSANLGWTDIDFAADVHVGDTLQVRSTVLSLRESRSRTDEGIVGVATTASNQSGELVLGFKRTLLVYRKSRATHYEASGY